MSCSPARTLQIYKRFFIFQSAYMLNALQIYHHQLFECVGATGWRERDKSPSLPSLYRVGRKNFCYLCIAMTSIWRIRLWVEYLKRENAAQIGECLCDAEMPPGKAEELLDILKISRYRELGLSLKDLHLILRHLTENLPFAEVNCPDGFSASPAATTIRNLPPTLLPPRNVPGTATMCTCFPIRMRESRPTSSSSRTESTMPMS